MKIPMRLPQILFFIWVGLAALTTSGCSLRRLAISHADIVAMRSLNGYVDLTSEQSDFVHQDLKSSLQWIKETQFPIAQRGLYEAENRLSGVITETDVSRLFDIAYKLREDIGIHLAPGGAKLAASLSPQQLVELEENFGHSNEPLEIRIGLKDAKLISTQNDKNFDFAEEFVGDLSEDQQVKMQEIYPPSREALQAALQSRKRNQGVILAALRSGKSQAELEQLFISWAKEPHLMRGDSKLDWEQREQKRRETTVRFIGILTEKQKLHFKKELSAIAKDLRL